MAQFDNENLNPEEEITGFQAGEQGDETFKLSQMEKYPGDLPEMISGEDKPLYESSPEDATSEEIEADVDQSSEPELSDDKDLEENVESQEINPGSEEKWNLIDDSEDDVAGGLDSEEEVEAEDEAEGPYADIFGDEPVSKDELRPTNPELSENPVNDDLKDIINSELERSKSRKEKKAEKIQDEAEQELADAAPLVQPTSSDGTETEMDFSEIPGDRPSNYGLKPVKVPLADKQTEQSKENVEEKREKKRSPWFWPIIVGSSVALILLTAFGTYFYLKGDQENKNYSLYLNLKNLGFSFDIPIDVDTVSWVSMRMEDFIGDDGIVDQDKVNQYLEQKASDVEKPETSQVDPKDSGTKENTSDPDDELYSEDDQGQDANDNPFREPSEKLNPDSEIDNYIQAEKDIEKTQSQSRVITKTKKNPFRDSQKDKESKVSNSASDISTKEKTLPKKQPKPEKINEQQDESKHIPIDKSSKATDSADKRADDLLAEIRNRQNKNLDETENDRSYTVQVFSTLSREDAEIWRKKLDNRKVGKAFISEHVIRDQIWYRVRVGDYKTREEALRAARKLGYAQVWVDRLK